MGWKGTEVENMTLGQYLRKNKTEEVSDAELETFIQNYYRGNEPQRVGDEPCNCTMYFQDNFFK